MADPELVKILKQGSEAWNRWRRQQPNDAYFDLSYAHLEGVDLGYAHLSYTNLRNADLRHTNLRNTDLRGTQLNYAYLSSANLNGINLRIADLRDADLRGASLRGADLNGASLGDADLSNANLSNADLSYANLGHAQLNYATLKYTNLSRAKIWQTVFDNVDLREVKGLAEIIHQGPSIVQLHTVQLPQDGSALLFLRGCGVPDDWIDDYRVRMMNPIQYHSCFISYSSQDDIPARRLHADLQDRGVRCWFAPEDMKIGDKIRSRIDEAIHLQEKLLLLLSKDALVSEWVEDEVEAALEKERRQQREVLFPVRLDNAVMVTNESWAAKLRRSRHIGDFTNWTDPQAYEQAFDRLLQDLKKADEIG